MKTERSKKVLNLADKLKESLKPFCKKIEIAGSIRRHEENPEDIDIVLIPKNKDKVEEIMKTKFKGNFIQGGEHESTWIINKIKVELYYTSVEEWGADLLAYSSTKGSAIGLRVIAKRKGFKLTQHGLFKGNKKVAGKTEKEIYSALGRDYKKPEDR
jgi:DNA polymerase (family 10)